MSACCGAVVRNECRDHFSLLFAHQVVHNFCTTPSHEWDSPTYVSGCV